MHTRIRHPQTLENITLEISTLPGMLVSKTKNHKGWGSFGLQYKTKATGDIISDVQGGFAHGRIGEETYDIVTGKAEAAQKRLFCQGVYFNSKERSFVQLAIKIDGKYCCCMKNTSGGRCTMTNSSISSSSNSSLETTQQHPACALCMCACRVDKILKPQCCFRPQITLERHHQSSYRTQTTMPSPRTVRSAQYSLPDACLAKYQL